MRRLRLKIFSRRRRFRFIIYLLYIIVYKKSLNAQKSTIDTGQSLCYNLLNQRRLPDIAGRLPDIAILSAPNKQNQKKGEQV